MKPTTSAADPLPSRFRGPGDSPGYLLWRISMNWQRQQRAALAPLGLTHSQFVVLATATWFCADEELTQARIAEITGMDAMTTSQVLRTLETAKLLQRQRHSTDPRARSIAVTAAGRRLAKKAVVVVEETDHLFFAVLGQELVRLTALFRKLAEALSASDPLTTPDGGGP